MCNVLHQLIHFRAAFHLLLNKYIRGVSKIQLSTTAKIKGVIERGQMFHFLFHIFIEHTKSPSKHTFKKFLQLIKS